MSEPVADTLAFVVEVIESETGRAGVDGDTRLAQLGVDSLVATKIVVRVRIVLGATIPMLSLFEDITVAEFATTVAAAAKPA